MRLSPRQAVTALLIVPAALALAACDSKTETAPATPPAVSAPAPVAPVTPAPTPETPPPVDSAANAPALGSTPWFEWVETTAGITDGQGHGPDHGSQEWCNAVSFKVYGQAPETEVTCDQVWMADIDARLRQRQP